MGENHFSKNTVAAYGFVLFMCAVSFNILQIASLKSEGSDSALGKVLKNVLKEKLSTGFYLISIIPSFFYPIISLILIFVVAMLWLIPDKRIEKNI
ncbi:hypothetical protein [Halpernia frigidisoli]|uniref:hypothetical protein n=1 Tax=Halpernia frigidisoli TaxID=1125876 RepID=UPI00267F0DFA|nr:hypothetical protein [Halpernia frigidisoli]